MAEITVVYKTMIRLDHSETIMFKQILEHAEGVSINLGPAVEELRRLLVAQLPQEA